MSGYVIFPTDHLIPDTGQMDCEDDDEVLLTTREKVAKMVTLYPPQQTIV